MLKRIITVVAVLAVCFFSAYAQAANDTKGNETAKKQVLAEAAKKEPVTQSKESAANQALQHALSTNKDRKVRRNAAKDLGDMKDALSVKVLVRHLNDADPAVRKAAYAALKKIGSPAVQPLTVALSHKNSLVRRQAVALISEISQAVPAVARTQKKDKDSAVHASAAGTISSVNKKQAPGLD